MSRRPSLSAGGRGGGRLHRAPDGLLNVDTSTASRFVEQATAGGYVRRDPSERDRRRCVVWLTGRGAGLLSAASVVRATPLEGLLSG